MLLIVGGTLNSGYGQMSRFAAVLVFLPAIPAGEIKTDITVHHNDDFHMHYKCTCTCPATLK